MLKIDHIVIGWFRAFFGTTDKIKKLSGQRLNHCRTCEHAKWNKLIEIINGKDEYVNSLICTKCSCPCLEKSLVKKEKCPIKKW